MSEGAVSGVKQFALRFSVLSENRKEPFTSDLESAAVFALAELDRAKGGGLILKQPEERVAFIAEIAYPLWLFPRAETALIFDGLNKSNYTLPYAEIPNVKVFMENLKRSSKTRETHVAFLSDHINYFQVPMTEKRLLINGLLRNTDFLSEFESYRREAVEIEGKPEDVTLLSPTLNELAISVMMKELENLQFCFKEDAKELSRCMKLLHKINNNFVGEVHDQARAVKEEFDAKIREEEAFVAPQVASIGEEYDRKIVDLAKNFEKQHLPVQKEKVKLEKSKDQVLARIDHYKLEAKTHAKMGDSVAEKKWKEKSKEAKQELSEIENQLKRTVKALKDLEERKSLEIIKLRSELEANVKEARQPLLELESSRDAKILIYNQEIEKLERLTKLIVDQLSRTAKLRETSIAQFEKLGVKQDSNSKNVALFYVPFYLACYQVEQKKRYLTIPPSVASTIGLSTKLKGALGRAKIKELLVPRFKTLTSLMDTIQVLAQENAIFETEINEIGAKTNLLNVSSVREEIKKGLVYLKNEGWLSDKEYEVFSQKIP